MKLFTSVFFFFTILLASAANTLSVSGGEDTADDTATRTFSIPDFNEIHLEGGFKVVLQQADKPGLKIKADEDDFDYIDVDVHNQVLDIGIKDRHFTFNQIILYISFRELEKLHIEGGAKLETLGYIELKDFFLHVEGGAKIKMKVKAENFKVVGEGGVSLNLEGIGKSLDAVASGASYINAEELKCERVKISIEGVGAGYVYATGFLDATIEGVGKISYKGDPEIHKNIGGLGFISKD